jgi:putative ABC transport system substrate-binding protein
LILQEFWMRFLYSTRREVISLLSGAAAAWPAAVRAQERVRRVGMLMPFSAEDRQARARLAALLQGLQQLGWNDGRNMQTEIRWGASTAEIRRNAAELVALAPDVIFASGSISVGVLTQTDGAGAVPIVFALVPDPIGAGYVASMSRPGGNVTGFTPFEYGIGPKWLELLKEIMPSATRAGVVRDATITAGIGQWGAIQAVAPSFGVEIFPVNVRDTNEIEVAVAGLARAANGGLIVTGSSTAIAQRDQIIMLAARYKVPAIYYDRYFAASGGLISYGPDLIDQFWRAARYVDRVLKGERPADLPVQAPTKYELVINLRTAKALGLEVPPMLLARGDEVIE